jgi:hypothetical protein
MWIEYSQLAQAFVLLFRLGHGEGLRGLGVI